jgi:hypothetical protein
LSEHIVAFGVKGGIVLALFEETALGSGSFLIPHRIAKKLARLQTTPSETVTASNLAFTPRSTIERRPNFKLLSEA